MCCIRYFKYISSIVDYNSLFIYNFNIPLKQIIMLISTNHHQKINTALVALTSLYAIGAAVALSTPYWVSSTSILAPLAVFAATPLGVSIFAFTAVVLTSLAIYTINKNNKISELKTSRIAVTDNKDIFLLVTEQDFEYIKQNNCNKNEEGSLIENECRIDFTLEGRSYYITAVVDDEYKMLGNTRFLEINSLGIKNDKNEFDVISNNKEMLKKLNLDTEKNDAKELSISFLSSSAFEAPEVEQGKTSEIGN